MKILQISPQVTLPLTDGAKLSIFGITQSLFEKGHQVDFVCYRKHFDSEKSISLLKEYCTPYILDVQTDNNFIDALKNLFSSIPYNTSKYIRKELDDFLIEYFKRNNPDIIQIEHLHLGWVVDRIRKLTKAPIILRQQNYETMIMKRFGDNAKNLLLKLFAKIQYFKMKKYEARLCEKFDKVVMISYEDEKRLKMYNPKIKSTTIPAGVKKELLNFNSTTPKEKNSIFHIGNLEWFPNIDSIKYFINEILPIVKDTIPDVKFYIYGGNLPNNVKIPEKVRNNIIEKGFVEDLWHEVANKSLAVVPLRIGSGMRLKIVELMAAGHVVLSTPIGAEGLAVTNKKEILIENNTVEFANTIIQFLNNKYDRHYIVNNARKFIYNNYTWDKITNQFIDLYENLLNSRRT